MQQETSSHLPRIIQEKNKTHPPWNSAGKFRAKAVTCLYTDKKLLLRLCIFYYLFCSWWRPKPYFTEGLPLIFQSVGWIEICKIRYSHLQLNINYTGKWAHPCVSSQVYCPQGSRTDIQWVRVQTQTEMELFQACVWFLHCWHPCFERQALNLSPEVRFFLWSPIIHHQRFWEHPVSLKTWSLLEVPDPSWWYNEQTDALRDAGQAQGRWGD